MAGRWVPLCIDKGIREMKKFLLGASIAASVALMASAAMAQTTVGTNWNGSGVFSFNANTTGSTGVTFGTGGNQAVGSTNYTVGATAPYGYGVLGTTFDANARVASGGEISSVVNRTGSYAPLYGAAGQAVSGYVSSSDGSAALVMHTTNNYAGLIDIGYGKDKTAGGNTLDASGSAIVLNYNLNTGVTGNTGGILVQGTGNAGLNLSSSGVSNGGFNLGQGQGIFTQANFSGQGVGTVSTGGVATGSLFVANSGSTVYGTVYNPASITTTINYDTTGNPANTQGWNFALGGTSSGPVVVPTPQ